MRRISILLVIIITVISLSGCTERLYTNTDKIEIIATIFPEYDWLLQILGDNPADISVELLLDNGTDMHSFQPTASDIIKLSACDMLIYVGGESDQWIEDVLKQALNQEMTELNLLQVLGDTAKEEIVIEGMQQTGKQQEEEEEEYDEHVWLSLKNACFICHAICEELCRLDPTNAEIYLYNTNQYVAQLEALDQKYQEMADHASFRTVVFGDRFPFRYLMDDYGISYYAAFTGCSAETEASFETLIYLIEKINELGLGSVLTIDGSDQKIAGTIVQNTVSKDQKVLTLDSIQSVTKTDINKGISYLSIMENNLEVLKEALKQEEVHGSVNR